MPEVGKRMMVFFGNGFVFAGDVVKQIGPFSFRMDNAVMICRTGGVPWDRLADGKDRAKGIYRHWGTTNVGPDFGPCRVWVGNLPEQTGE